eukprot:3173250-Karenia_brevis.AAC.1
MDQVPMGLEACIPPMGKGQRPNGSSPDASYGNGLGDAMVSGPSQAQGPCRGCLAAKPPIWPQEH